jgi:Cap4 dsDNA endonuclease
MAVKALKELVHVATSPEYAEVGGGHNQKGIEFQRHWGLMRMFELAEAGQTDFLMLFEAIQDIAVLDSATSPTAIAIYQVKKKDRKEWAWSELTGLHAPSAKAKPLDGVKSSPIGKLYETVNAFSTLASSGRFLSNAGCDVPLASGQNAALFTAAPLSALADAQRELLTSGLSTLHLGNGSAPDLSKIFFERTDLPVNSPGPHVVGIAHGFLAKRSPRHAGQAQSLVESLLTKIAPLGARTEPCADFDEVKARHGYSLAEFSAALGELEKIPDVIELLTMWATKLSSEGMDFLELTRIQVAAASIYQRQVMGTVSSAESALAHDCDAYLSAVEPSAMLLPFFDEAYKALAPSHTEFRKAEILAHFALRAITKCAAQT